MRTPFKQLLTAITGMSLLAAVSLQANTVTVTELGIGANETVWINSSNLGNNLHVYAGVVKLNVDGTLLDGFCIDPWHWSQNGPLAYNLESLVNAPKSANNTTPNPMGAAAAQDIEQLWLKYYSPGISNITAAALQIKIWQIVDAAVNNGTFTLRSVDHHSTEVYAALDGMNAFLANDPNAASASLVAVTGRGQDYVIPGRIPETGTTLAMLGCSLLGLVALRRRFVA